MILRTISLKNYRNFEEYSLDLGKRITMLIGRNGMGKTNLISSMVQAMSFIFSKQRDMPQTEFIRSSDQGVKRFAVMDARFTEDNHYPLYIRAKAEINGGIELNWGLEQDQNQALQLFNDRQIKTAWDEKEEKWYFSIVDAVAVLHLFSISIIFA